MAKNFTARIRIIATDKASAVIGRVQTRMATLGAFIKKNMVLALGAAAVAFAVLVKGMKSAITASNVQEDAIKKLDTALKPLGKDAAAVSKRMQDFASELQKVTTAGDETTIAGIALLASFTKNEEEMKGATQAALDLSAATGTSLKSAFLLMGRAASGETSTLSRYGITLEKGLPPSEKFAAALVKINEQFGGQAQAKAETFSGRMTQLGNAFGDTSELVGDMITRSNTFTAAIVATTQAILKLNILFAAPVVSDHEKSLMALESAYRRVTAAENVRLATARAQASFGSATANAIRVAITGTTQMEAATDRLRNAEELFAAALKKERQEFEKLNKEQGKNLELDKAALTAAEKLGIVLQENVNVAIEEKRKAIDLLRKSQQELGLSDGQLAEQERALVAEQERLQAAFDASGGSLEKYNAALVVAKAALDPVVAGLVAAREAVASYNVETEQTIQQQQVLAKALVFTAEKFRQVARDQGRAAAVAAALAAGARRGIGNRIEFFDEFGRRTGSELGPGGSRFRLFSSSSYGQPYGTNSGGTCARGRNIDGTCRRY